MAFLPKCYIEKEIGTQTEVVGALAWTRKRVLYSESTYRDSFNAAFMGGAIPNADNDTVIPPLPDFSGGLLALGTNSTEAYSTRVPQTIPAPGAGIQAISLSDEISHTPWRIKTYIRWLIQFWDAATVGQAMTISATTVSGTPTITVPDNELLTPGQAITGTGIPDGTIILRGLSADYTASGASSLPITTTAILSQNATASATVAATLTGANCLASYFEDEIIGWGGPISFPI